MIIGICGPSGSGKSHYSKLFKTKIESKYTSVKIIHMDNFFKGIYQYDTIQKEALEKELTYAEGFLKSVDKKLSNERFVNNAPDQVVVMEKKKKADAEAKVQSIKEALKKLGN